MTVEIPSILLPCPQKYMKYSGLKKEKTEKKQMPIHIW